MLYSGSQLLGIDGEADVGGFGFDFDPVATLLHYRQHVGSGYFDAAGDYGYDVDTSLDAAIAAAPFAAAVPEPSTWALVLAGAGVVGISSRRRGASAARCVRPTFALGTAGIAAFTLSGCGGVATPIDEATRPGLAMANRCDTNADHATTGVLHAATKRELDDCRRGR